MHNSVRICCGNETRYISTSLLKDGCMNERLSIVAEPRLEGRKKKYRGKRIGDIYRALDVPLSPIHCPQ